MKTWKCGGSKVGYLASSFPCDISALVCMKLLVRLRFESDSAAAILPGKLRVKAHPQLHSVLGVNTLFRYFSFRIRKAVRTP